MGMQLVRLVARHAPRDSSKPFGAPLPVSELTIVFYRTNPTGDDTNLYVATRTAINLPFAGAAQVANVNSAVFDSMPWIAVEGNVLLFSSNRAPVVPARRSPSPVQRRRWSISARE
jgi:hypothetical protein